MTYERRDFYSGGAADYRQHIQPDLTAPVNYELSSVKPHPTPARKPLLEMANRIERKADSLLEAVSHWDSIAPSIKRTKDHVQALRESLEDSPEELDRVSFQPLHEQLTLAADAMDRVPSIPFPLSSTGPIFDSTASGTSFVGVDYANFAVRTFPNSNSVCDWGAKTRLRFEALYNEDDRRHDAQKRLNQLSPELGELFEAAVNTTIKCATRLREPTGAAQEQRLVLEKFKGKLIALSKGQAPRSQHYAMIAQRLAANSPLTMNMVAKGQEEYDDLHQELTDIQKRNKRGTPAQMASLLERIERHVLEITSALDPGLTGISFG